MRTKAQIKASAKFNKQKAKGVDVRLNVNTDADIIDHLATVPSKAGYIKKLIRQDMERSK